MKFDGEIMEILAAYDLTGVDEDKRGKPTPHLLSPYCGRSRHWSSVFI